MCGFIQHLSGDTAIICAKWDSRYDEMVTAMKWSLRWNSHCDGIVTAMEWPLQGNVCSSRKLKSHKTLYIAPRDRSALNGRETLCLIMADELSHTSRAIVALASNETYHLQQYQSRRNICCCLVAKLLLREKNFDCVAIISANFEPLIAI